MKDEWWKRNYLITCTYVEPVHLVVGGVFGALGGYLMFHGAKAMQERVIIGKKYYKRIYEEEKEINSNSNK